MFPTQHLPHEFSCMVRLRKKLKRAIYVGSVLLTSATCGRLYVCTVYPYLFVLYYLCFPRDLQFQVIHICVFSMIMALRKKRVRTLHDRLKIIHEVEKNPGEKRVDIAKLTRTVKTFCLEKSYFQLRQNSAKKHKTGKALELLLQYAAAHH
jgi:hypothetical protein